MPRPNFVPRKMYERDLLWSTEGAVWKVGPKEEGWYNEYCLIKGVRMWRVNNRCPWRPHGPEGTGNSLRMFSHWLPNPPQKAPDRDKVARACKALGRYV